MSLLYQRLTGINQPQGSTRIPIHSFIALVFEFERGAVTGPNAIALLGLSPEEITDVNVFFGLLTSANNKLDFMRLFKDCLYLAETGYLYTTPVDLLARLQAYIDAQ